MIYIRAEGERLRQGFNFYHLRDRHSRGFILMLGSLKLRARWSVFRRCLFLSIETPRRMLFGRAFPRPRERFTAEADWNLYSRIRVKTGEPDDAA